MDANEQLGLAIASVPPGRWGVAVSGGADSVALLHLLRARTDLQLVVVHLDHETRQGQSTEDARFVAAMAASAGLPLEASTRRAIEPHLTALPANPQALYRALRHELYRRAVAGHDLAGIVLAHHADDQAETVLMRLLRGTGIEGLRGIPQDTVLGGIRLIRPLLPVRRSALRDFLRANHLTWREDASNASPKYQRNRVRLLLDAHPELIEPLLEVARAFTQLSSWLDQRSPVLPSSPMIRSLRELPPLVLLHVLRKWLLEQGIPGDEVSLALLARVRTMVEDSASPPAISAPGAIEIRRRGGHLIATASPARSPRPAPPGSSARYPRAPGRQDPPEATP